MIHVDETGVPAWIDREIEELEGLAADLRRIRNRTGPTADELEQAPLIDRYQFFERASLFFEGYITGHPRFGKRLAHTTQVWVFAPRLGWARTSQRFYRLGAAKDENDGAPKGLIDPE